MTGTGIAKDVKGPTTRTKTCEEIILKDSKMESNDFEDLYIALVLLQTM